jgi:hypothetical protein
MLNLGATKALSIFDKIIPDGLSHAATSFVESLKINSLSEEKRRGGRVIVKRRNVYGARAADLINFYFRISGTGIRYISETREWQRWETKCFNMLNGDRFKARVLDARTIEEQKLPGKSLWQHMNDRTLTRRMLEAAGREYRRAHRMNVAQFRGGWSHGDASMPNVIYDEASGRARLIDFEMMHERSWPARARHADDLLVFLLDMVDRVSSRCWLPFALAFVRGYDDVDLARELRKRLVVPRGFALIWWNVRTNFAKSAKVRRRFAALRRALVKVDLQSRRARPRKRRRPSIHCHRSKPGMPTPSSRMRATRDSAKAASPGIPRRLPTKT